jgi:hypothetical protein
MSSLRTRSIVLLADEELNFKEIFAIQKKEVARQAFAMSKFFEKAVGKEGNNNIYFDVAKAIEMVKQDDNRTLIQYTDQTLTQTNDAVEVMVEQVLGLLNSLLDIALNEKQKGNLRESINNVFTNLAPQEGNAWIFWSKTDAHKSAYQYNILFAVQNADTGYFLYGLPMGMTIEAEISKEQVLFIKLKDKASYSVRVQAIKVAEFLDVEIQRRAMAILQGKSY